MSEKLSVGVHVHSTFNAYVDPEYAFDAVKYLNELTGNFKVPSKVKPMELRKRGYLGINDIPEGILDADINLILTAQILEGSENGVAILGWGAFAYGSARKGLAIIRCRKNDSGIPFVAVHEIAHAVGVQFDESRSYKDGEDLIDESHCADASCMMYPFVTKPAIKDVAEELLPLFDSKGSNAANRENGGSLHQKEFCDTCLEQVDKYSFYRANYSAGKFVPKNIRTHFAED